MSKECIWCGGEVIDLAGHGYYCPQCDDNLTEKEVQPMTVFEKITNGDKIRKMSNKELAEYFIYESGAMFASTLIVDKTFDTFDEAIEVAMEYLNAPAESEGEDE